MRSAWHELVRAGFYEGDLQFTGEQGFTTVSKPSLRVPPLYHDPAVFCFSVDEYHGGSRGVMLTVLARWGRTSVVQNMPNGKVRVAASAVNRVHGISISRGAEVIAPPSSFTWAADLHRARLAPPAPFSGSAVYGPPDGNRSQWRGNLTVDFPGFPNYPLAPGPALTEFEHGYCHVLLPRGGPFPIGPCLH